MSELYKCEPLADSDETITNPSPDSGIWGVWRETVLILLSFISKLRHRPLAFITRLTESAHLQVVGGTAHFLTRWKCGIGSGGLFAQHDY